MLCSTIEGQDESCVKDDQKEGTLQKNKCL